MKKHLWHLYQKLGINGPAQALWRLIGGDVIKSLVVMELIDIRLGPKL